MRVNIFKKPRRTPAMGVVQDVPEVFCVAVGDKNVEKRDRFFGRLDTDRKITNVTTIKPDNTCG